MRATQRGKQILKRSATAETQRAYPGHRSPQSPRSHPGVIPPHGGYEKLCAYSKSQIIYDATVRFCDRFINAKSRTHDQMVQAARSGNKNIAEGSRISGTSKEAELKLTNVARSSLEELLGIIRITCASTATSFGTKTLKRPCSCANLGKTTLYRTRISTTL